MTMVRKFLICTWRSEHYVEIDDEATTEEIANILQAYSTAELVGFTTKPVAESLDDTLNDILEESP